MNVYKRAKEARLSEYFDVMDCTISNSLCKLGIYL